MTATMNILSSPLCIFATLLLFGVEDVTSHGCGDIHSQLCLTTIRTNMAQDTRYWFGTSYAANCPNGSNTGSWECLNSDPYHKSVITRMRNSTSNDTSMFSKILNVTWYVQPGAYEACFNTYTPGLVNWTIDPAHPTHQPLWSLLQMPSVTWDADPGENYTLIFWDAGALQLRGLYINIKGSDLTTGQTVYSYRGADNPSPTLLQPHLIAIFNQTEYLDIDDAVGEVDYYFKNQIGNLDSLLTNFMLEGPVGVSVLAVMGDPYSAELMRKMRKINNCPFYVTAEFNKLNLSYNVSSVNLTVLLDVVYQSESMELDNCCNTTKIVPAKVVRANPIGNGNISAAYTQMKPTVTLEQQNLSNPNFFFGKLYSFLMLDITDELNSSATMKNVRVQWQIVNIRDGTLDSGNEIVPYLAPDPMPRMNNRTFLFLLLRQSGPVSSIALQSADSRDTCTSSRFGVRCHFNLTKFIVALNLVIEGASWFNSWLDEDYKLVMARDGVMMSLETVCASVACTPTDTNTPATTSIPATISANCLTSYGADNRPSAVMLVVVFAFLRWLM